MIQAHRDALQNGEIEIDRVPTSDDVRIECADTLAKRIEARPIRDDQEVHIEIDGELPGKLPATYEVVPGALKIRVPKTD